MNENDRMNGAEPDAIANLLRRHFERTAANPVDVGQYTWQLVAPHLPLLDERESFMETHDPDTTTLTFTAPEVPSPPPQSLYRRQGWRGMATSAALLIAVMLVAAFFIAHNSRPGISSSSPNGPTSIMQSAFRSVSMVTPNEGWAVGVQATVALSSHIEKSDDGGLLNHYSNGAWQAVDLSNILPPLHLESNLNTGGENGYLSGLRAPELNSVSMDSATDGWAVGDKVFLHYDGTTWHSVTPPDHLVFIAVQMLARDDGWAISGSAATISGGDAFLFHYDGKSWQKIPLPSFQIPIDNPANVTIVSPANGTPTSSYGQIGNLTGIDMLSGEEGWITAGITLPPSAETVKYNGWEGVNLHYLRGTWTVQYALPYAVFDSISMISADEGWAAAPGLPGPPGIDDYNLYHYQFGSWTVGRVIPRVGTIGDRMSLVMIGANDGWLASTNDFQPGNAITATGTFLMHYDGHTWQQASLPLSLKGDPLVFAGFNGFSGSSNDVWAVGGTTWAHRYALTVTIKEPSSILPTIPASQSPGVTGPTPAPITLTGYYPKVTPLLAHYTNGKWTIAAP